MKPSVKLKTEPNGEQWSICMDPTTVPANGLLMVMINDHSNRRRMTKIANAHVLIIIKPTLLFIMFVIDRSVDGHASSALLVVKRTLNMPHLSEHYTHTIDMEYLKYSISMTHTTH